MSYLTGQHYLRGGPDTPYFVFDLIFLSNAILWNFFSPNISRIVRNYVLRLW